MMRTTLDIDDPVLKEIKVIHEKEGRSMGSVVSQLLAEALVRRSPSQSLVDLADKESRIAQPVLEHLGRT